MSPPRYEVAIPVACTKCGAERDWPDKSKGAGKPISGERVLTVEHHEPCPDCGGLRVRIDVEIG